MRLSQFVFILLISFAVKGQMPAGLANTFDLSERVGFKDKNFVSFFEYAASGKIYAKDYNSGVYLISNNAIRLLKGQNEYIDNGSQVIVNGNELYLFHSNQFFFVIRGDSIVLKLRQKINGKLLNIQQYQNQINSFYLDGNQLVYCVYRKHQWQELNRFNIPAHIKASNIRYLISNKSGIFLGVEKLVEVHEIYQIDTSKRIFKYISSIPKTHYSINYFSTFFNGDFTKYKSIYKDFDNFYLKRTGVSLTEKLLYGNNVIGTGFFSDLKSDTTFLYRHANNLAEYITYKSRKFKTTSTFHINKHIQRIIRNPKYPYLTALTSGKTYRIFPYVKKYPKIYDKDNSNSIFIVTQDNSGRIWAGSYNKDLSIIDTNGHVVALKRQPYSFMDAALNYKDKIYLVGETESGGILEYNKHGKMRKLLPQIPTGYYLYQAPKGKKIYFPTGVGPGYEVYYCDENEIDNPFVHWKKLDKTVGVEPIGFSTVTEDTLGRIWLGHTRKGFAVYNPKINKAITYDTRKKQSHIGFMSSLTDSKGTVWLGSAERGLWYYNAYHKSPSPTNLKQINHPLLNTVKVITAMTVYKNWLVLACSDRICLFDLESFYKKNKIIVQYLNQQEAALTSTTEQNTMLVSKLDSTIWFSTNDMLYQWDIKTWLALPKYRVNVAAFLEHDSYHVSLNPKKPISLKADINSFDLSFEYLSPDALPRFTRSALIKDGDKLVFNEPGNQSQFTFKNQSSGRYTFYIEVFEQDGTTSMYKYRIIIQEFFWKQWWFWALCSFILIVPIILWLNTRRKRALMAKEISQLNVITLSGQFRPHFILNALNTIGADLKDKPLAESIISRLGESINLIFNQSQQKVVCHSLKNEWLLVENVIQIHRIMYLPDLKVSYVGSELLNEYEDLKVPLGILETNVENALLHGLRNKRNPPYSLSIAVNADNDYFYFEIMDDGIGRKAAVKLSSYKKHGTGIKNLNAIIDILNKFNKHKISIDFLDNQKEGTVVNIKIPKEYRYKY